MKKMLLICSALLFVSFLVPFLYVTGAMEDPNAKLLLVEDSIPEGLEGYEEITILPAPSDFSSRGEIRAGRSDSEATVTVEIDGRREVLGVDDYLVGVISGEMPAGYPTEALKAQAVAARTYMYYMMDMQKHDGADVCADPACCQVYRPIEAASEAWGGNAALYRAKISYAVSRTDGQILLYEGKPALAVFHATSSGVTESSVDIWGTDLPYLRGVASPGDLEAEKYEGRVEVPLAECRARILERWPDAQPDESGGNWFTGFERTDGGHVISLEVGGVTAQGPEIRAAFGLLSSNFTVTIDGDTVVFATKGYGHGVGMSQTGARAMALEGSRYHEILEWYYPGCEIG